MNKSMTTLHKYFTSMFFVSIIMLFALFGLLLSCRTAAPSAPATADRQTIEAVVARTPVVVQTPQPRAGLVPPAATTTLSQSTPVATAPLTPTQLFLAPVLQMAGGLTPFTITHPPTATTVLAELLSQTTEVQARVAVSMATMARTLAESVQPPLTTTAPLSQPLVLSVTALLSDALALPAPTIAPTAFPPTNVPPAVVQDAPALTMTNPLTQVSPYPVPAPPAQLPADGEVRRAYVPILMYHYLSVPPANTDIYRRDLSIDPERFAAHLDRLQAEGYTTISLYALHAYLTQGAPLPPKPVVITFDDGYRDNYENALPLLTARKMTATFFIVVDFINRERPEYLSWEMVRALHAAGMSVEAHGIDHTTLRGRSAADLEYQALRSYETIQDRIGVRPRFISYPAGEYDAATITMFQSAGYWAGFTTVQGATHRSDELFTLRRVRMRNTTTADELIRLLTADW